ncbi:hypothetical protein [Rhizobium sp. BK602]|uniref:hypothetical protein n=1 Tax=Rhizobium sp. BK602 TaxID=2586986 RepID=UPI0016217193|nr:hypothetical protein [Rhizobium sp. BK602]MBB3608102.1 hypothetical protein [Rhizobium sp. BK602]
MSKIFNIVGAGALTLIMGFASVTPSVAAPLNPAKPAVGAASTAIEQVQYRERDGRRWEDRRHRPNRRPPHYRPGYWKGYQGYRHARPGYRRHSDGFWYPRSAFTIIIR